MQITIIEIAQLKGILEENENQARAARNELLNLKSIVNSKLEYAESELERAHRTHEKALAILAEIEES